MEIIKEETSINVHDINTNWRKYLRTYSSDMQAASKRLFKDVIELNIRKQDTIFKSVAIILKPSPFLRCL